MPRMKGFGRNVARVNAPPPQKAEVEGTSVRVNGDAIRTWQTAAAKEDSGIHEILDTWDVGSLRDSIGKEGLRRAAADAGREPPSDRTIRRWVQNNRIPHAEVADRVQRRTLVTRSGGVDEFASKVGLSSSAIRRYQRGATTHFRQQRHQRVVEEAKTADMLSRSGIADGDGNLLKSPVISLTAAFEYRYNGSTSPDYRSTRTFDIAGMSDTDSQEFVNAVAREDDAAAIAVIERHLSTDYATTFEGFDDHTGFHMTYISEFNVKWE